VEAGQLLTTDVPYYALLSLLNHLDLRFGPPYANLVNTGIGAEFVRDLLAQIDLEVLAGQLHQEVSETGGLHQAQARERLSLVEAFRQSGTRPEWMILTVIPVLPPVLWPMVSLDGCRYARRCPHLGDLYRLVIQRNNRLQRLQELGVPLVLIVHEKRMLQEAVDALIELTWDVYLRLRTQKNGHDPAKD
jgi:DNA-directed RNA polymerase subunit beta'